MTDTEPGALAAKTGIALAAGMLFAAGCGLVAALGQWQLTAMVMGAMLACVIIAAPPQAMVACVLALSFVITGLLQYFARVSQGHWIVALLFAVMLCRFPFDWLSMRRDRPMPGPMPVGPRLRPLLLFPLAFAGAVIMSIAVNVPPLMQTVVGLKHYLFPLGLAAVVACMAFRPVFWNVIWRAIPILMIAQFPVAVYQYFFVERKRSADVLVSTSSWDAVVGTFGGDPEGGGASGALALFMCFGCVAALALYREKLIGRRLAWGALLSAVAVISLAEVKFVVILLPIAFLVYARRRIIRSPLSALCWVGGSAILLPGLLLIYNVVHWNPNGGSVHSVPEAMQFAFSTELDDKSSTNRANALTLWWKLNASDAAPLSMLFGYGPAASKISDTIGRADAIGSASDLLGAIAGEGAAARSSATFGYGEAAKRFPYRLATSSLSALLWDLGIAGALCTMGMLAAAAVAALRAAGRLSEDDRGRRAIYETCGAGLILILVELPYNLDAVSNPAVQTMMMTMIGLVLASPLAAERAHRSRMDFHIGSRPCL